MMGDSKTQQQATKLGTSCVQPSIVQELVAIVSNDLKRLSLSFMILISYLHQFTKEPEFQNGTEPPNDAHLPAKAAGKVEPTY